jgi:hypothetical protein
VPEFSKWINPGEREMIGMRGEIVMANLGIHFSGFHQGDYSP